MVRKGKRNEVDEPGVQDPEEFKGQQKKARIDDPTNGPPISINDGALVTLPGSLELTVSGNVRSKNSPSILPSPTVLLTGHTEAVYSLTFDPTGEFLASSSLDKNIMLWDVKGGGQNYNVLSGHKNGVIEVKWASTDNRLVSCSADKSVALWDANRGTRLRKYADHTAIVNSCSIARDQPNTFASGSDDCTVIIWDQRDKYQRQCIYHEYQVTSVCMSADGSSVFTGGIDNIIRKWDLRMNNTEEATEVLLLPGHTDTITGLSLSVDGNYLLSNGMDSTLRRWDVKPFFAGQDPAARCERIFAGVHHGAEKLLLRCAWSPDQERVACGSADRLVHVWDATSGEKLYLLPGHKGSVNDVIFHPHAPVIASCGSDKQIFLGELSE